jgi:hypothetical protein
MVPERRLRTPADRRNRWRTVPGAAGSGELFRRPGGVFARGRRGESERRGRPTYRRVLDGHYCEIRRGVIAGRFWFPGREERAGEEGADMWGSTCQRGGQRSYVPIRVEGFLGCGLVQEVGRNGAPGSVLYFYFLFFFSFFWFLIPFIAFAYWIQTDSNNFVKFSKIHSKVLNQHQTCFHN